MANNVIPWSKYSSFASLYSDWTVFTELPIVHQKICFLQDQLGCFATNFIPVSLLSELMQRTLVISDLFKLLILPTVDTRDQIVVLTCFVNIAICPLAAEWFVDRPAYFVTFFAFLPVVTREQRLKQCGDSDYYKRTSETMWVLRHLATDSDELRETCLEWGVLNHTAETISAMYEAGLNDTLSQYMWGCRTFLDYPLSEFDSVYRMVPVLGRLVEAWEERPFVAAGAIALLSLVINQSNCQFASILSQLPDLFSTCTRISRSRNNKIQSRFSKLLLSISCHPEGLLKPWYDRGLIYLLNGVLFSCQVKDDHTLLWAISNFLCTSHSTVWDGDAIRDIMEITMVIAQSSETPKSTLVQCVYIFYNVFTRNGGPLIQFLISEGILTLLQELVLRLRDDPEMAPLLCEILYWIVVWNTPEAGSLDWKGIFRLIPPQASNQFWRHLDSDDLDLPQIEKLSLRDSPSPKRLPDIATLSLNDE